MQTEAMVLDRHGGPEVLERRTIPIDPPGPCEARVRVHAVAMNHMDLWVRRGGPAFKLQYPHRLGCDIAGVVDELGPGARGVAVGDRVMVQPGLSCGICRACLSGRDNLCRSYRILGENAQGGYARHLNVPDRNLVKVDAKIGFAELAALPLCTLTAWQMVFEKARVKAGQTVIVHAAGSGVSSIAIKLCKLVGARVLATTTSPDKVEPAHAIGADEVIVTGAHAKADYVAEVKRLTGRAGADVILDHVGGELIEKAVSAVAWGGRIVTCGATAGFAATIDMRQIFFRQIELLGSTMGSKSDLLEALPMILDGRLRATVDRELSLWQAREAHEALEARQVFGKVVLTVD
jgi:NADPH:quinone reductase-like Zn-dependent oxidoreductase